MNERTKELIIESVNFTLDPDSKCYVSQVCPEELEYLAELIIRECVHTVENRGGMCGALSSNWIKEHFGVE